MKRATLFLAAFLCCTSIIKAQQGGSLGINTIVIDPGHGGKDPGCSSRDGKTREKDITLDIAKSLSAKIKAEYPQVKVVCTRDSDKYVTLNERADIANRNHANLFVSIHVNANNSTSPNGFSTHILGQSSKKDNDLFSNNMDVCRRENSVILLEEDYSTKYKGFDPADPESFIFFHLLQNAYYEQSLRFAAKINAQMAKGPFETDRGIFQDPFYVLWRTTMPAVLIEAGFISNGKDLAKLRDRKSIDKIAESVFDAFKDFKAAYDQSVDISAKPAQTKDAAVVPEAEKPQSVAASPVAEPVPASSPKPITESSSPKPAAVPASKPASVEQPQEAHKEQESVSSVKYAVQLLATTVETSLDDPYFKGHPVKVYKDGKMFKYVTAETTSSTVAVENLKKVSREFPDCFIAIIEGESIRFFRK